MSDTSVRAQVYAYPRALELAKAMVRTQQGNQAEGGKLIVMSKAGARSTRELARAMFRTQQGRAPGTQKL